MLGNLVYLLLKVAILLIYLYKWKPVLMYKTLFFIALLGVAACTDDDQNAGNLKEYDGPVSEISDTEILYSDSAKLRVRVEGKKQLEFENGDQEFPEGFYIEFFDPEGIKTSTIKANQGKFDQKENLYTATGEVIVRNLIEENKLETEVLHWSPEKHEIFTDRYVEITTGEEVLMGEGLTADEDFSSYRILKPTGSFSINN